jgi:hypothetical protein
VRNASNTADAIIAGLTLILFVALLVHFSQLDNDSKEIAKEMLRASIREGIILAPDRVTNTENKR